MKFENFPAWNLIQAQEIWRSLCCQKLSAQGKVFLFTLLLFLEVYSIVHWISHGCNAEDSLVCIVLSPLWWNVQGEVFQVLSNPEQTDYGKEGVKHQVFVLFLYNISIYHFSWNCSDLSWFNFGFWGMQRLIVQLYWFALRKQSLKNTLGSLHLLNWHELKLI